MGPLSELSEKVLIKIGVKYAALLYIWGGIKLVKMSYNPYKGKLNNKMVKL